MANFDNCDHVWKFHVDADKSGFPSNKPWQSFFICNNCGSVINMQEKCALDSVNATKKSLKIGIWANIVSSIVLIISFLTLRFGDKIIAYFK